jgi:hypothetical protein
MNSDETGKVSLSVKEKELKDNIEKLPGWAKPIAQKYWARYKEAANRVNILEPDAILKFSQAGRVIIEEMTAEITKEAERRGYNYAVAIKKNIEKQATLTAKSKWAGNNQPKN